MAPFADAFKRLSVAAALKNADVGVAPRRGDNAATARGVLP
jgi:hypothetical protein